MMSRILKHYIHNLIRDNKRSTPWGYHLSIDDISLAEKKVFLCNLVHPSDYESFYETPEGIAAAVSEYSSEMQDLIDAEVDEVWAEDMEERGLRKHYHNDGELVWMRA